MDAIDKIRKLEKEAGVSLPEAYIKYRAGVGNSNEFPNFYLSGKFIDSYEEVNVISTDTLSEELFPFFVENEEIYCFNLQKNAPDYMVEVFAIHTIVNSWKNFSAWLEWSRDKQEKILWRERNILVEKINEAFADTKYPGNENIVAKTQYDDEVKECESKFVGKKWQEIDSNIINNEGYASGCVFLTDEAYRYFLPAYMKAIIENYHAMEDSVDVVVDSLKFPTTEDYTKLLETPLNHNTSHVTEFIKRRIENIDEVQKRFLMRMKGFTPEQKSLIVEFLNWLSKNHSIDFVGDEPKQAVERYWNK